MNAYQYRLTTCGHTVESNSAYRSDTHELLVSQTCDEPMARKICDSLGMQYLKSVITDGLTRITALCTEKTSGIIWAGGKA